LLYQQRKQRLIAPFITGMTEIHVNITPFLNESAAADYLGLSPATLARWRSRGEQGPVFRKFGGAVRYAVADLEAYANGAEVRR
jgi:hypothetical protein